MKQSEISTILNSLINKKIDYDGVYGHQCVDLVYYVLREVYGMKNWLNLRNGAAKDMAEPIAYREFASQLEFIPNTPEFIPQVGDMCVTLGGQYNGFFGHVFMILAGSTVSQMHTLEQNTGNGDGKGEDDRTLARWRNYDNILTFVRWKGIETNQTIISNNNNQDIYMTEIIKQQVRQYFTDTVRSHNLTEEEINKHSVIGRPRGLVDANDITTALGEFNTRLQWALDERDAKVVTPVPTIAEPYQEAPTINEQGLKQFIQETAKRFNLNDWVMGWLTFGIDKWSIISGLIGAGAYYMQNNVDAQYHPLIAYSAVGWSTLILVFFLYNKAKK